MLGSVKIKLLLTVGVGGLFRVEMPFLATQPTT